MRNIIAITIVAALSGCGTINRQFTNSGRAVARGNQLSSTFLGADSYTLTSKEDPTYAEFDETGTNIVGPTPVTTAAFANGNLYLADPKDGEIARVEIEYEPATGHVVRVVMEGYKGSNSAVVAARSQMVGLYTDLWAEISDDERAARIAQLETIEGLGESVAPLLRAAFGLPSPE